RFSRDWSSDVCSSDLGINHVIEVVGVTNGVMESPIDGSYAVGWYPPDSSHQFGVPDEEGNLVFSAHETWNHMQGPFYYVHKARRSEERRVGQAGSAR